MDYSSLIRSPNALTLMCLMLHETGEGKRPFQMSQAQIGKALGIGRQQVREALVKLVGLGMIQPTSQPSGNQPNNQVATYLTCCKIDICSRSKTKQQPTSQPSGNQPNNQAAEQFETLWTAYKRKGSKKIALRRWLMLTDEERAAALIHAPIYRDTRQTQFCKALEAYLNQKAWEGAITTDYGLELDPRKSRILADEKRFGFYDYYNNKVQGTLIPTVEGDPEERRVLVNIVFSYFPWERIEAVIDKAVQDPYNSGALPLSAGKHVQTFEEIMHPDNILKANE